MASKTGRKANAAAAAATATTTTERDDGTRWVVRDTDTKALAYLSTGGVTKAEATRLATGRVASSYIEQVS